MNKTVYNIGINDYPNCETHIRSLWKSILTRCYSKITHNKQPAYIGCSVDSSWHKLSDFRTWFLQSNWKPGLQLDKDITNRGNKVYGPKNCSFVSCKINNLFTYNKIAKDKDSCVVGVSFNKKRNMYQSMCRVNNKLQFLGWYRTEIAAFNAYKAKKESVIKMVATEEYSLNNCTKEIYDIMMKWTI